MLGQFFVGFHAVSIRRERKVRKRRHRGEFEAEFLLDAARFEEGAEQLGIRQAHVDGPAHQTQRLFPAARKFQPARQAQQIHPVARPHIGGVAEGFRDDSGEAGQRDDIEHVVVEHRQQAMRAARAQVFEEDVRNHLARDVAGTFHTQNLVLQIHQAAAFEAEFEEAPRAVEQVEMLHPGEGMARAAHGVAGFEQRLVVGSAVVGNQDVEAGEMRGQGVQHGSFLRVIPHEELADTEAFVIDAAETDQKRVGAGTARKTGGLGVEKRPAGGVRVANGAVGQRFEHVGLQRDQIGNFVTPVTLVMGIELFGLEMPAVRGFDHLPGEQFLHEHAGLRGGGRCVAR